MKNDNAPETLLAQLGHYLDGETGGVTPPFQPSTTFARHPDYSLISPSHIYARDDNSLTRLAESILARLENGTDALLWPSGLAAVAALVTALGPGRPIFIQKGIYYGTTVWTRRYSGRMGLELVEFDAGDLDGLALRAKAAEPALIWTESPSNPWLDIVDLAAVSKIARASGSVFVVDSTAATPIHAQPLDFGADIVLHSATKSLNGHSDVLAGLLVAKDATAPIWQTLKQDRHDAGAVLGGFEAWLLLRGLRTLSVRVRAASANAQAVADFLHAHPRIERVRYPGRPDHPRHDLAKRQMRDGFGSLLSFDVIGGAKQALDVAGRLNTIIRATSLGGVESLVEHRHTIEGAHSDVPENLLRLSIGIEAIDDLIADLDQALG